MPHRPNAGRTVDANGNSTKASGGAGNQGISGSGGAGSGSGGGQIVDPVTGLPIPTPTPTIVPPDVSGAPGIPVFTPRFSRLSYRQWVNATKDLLMLADLGGIETRITKDALAGFDNEAEKLTVREPLRSDYQAAAEQLSA